MSAIRRAEATWSGDLTTGTGTVSRDLERAVPDLPVTLGRPDRVVRRQDEPGGARRGRPCLVLRDGAVGRPRRAGTRRTAWT